MTLTPGVIFVIHSVFLHRALWNRRHEGMEGSQAATTSRLLKLAKHQPALVGVTINLVPSEVAGHAIRVTEGRNAHTEGRVACKES